jgi:hypothetical protein
MYEAAEELLPLLQRPRLQDFAESPQIGQRVAGGGLQVDGVVFSALEIAKAGFKRPTLDSEARG